MSRLTTEEMEQQEAADAALKRAEDTAIAYATEEIWDELPLNFRVEQMRPFCREIARQIISR